MTIETILDRILGFMPHRGIFWMGLLQTVIMFSVRFTYDWLAKKWILPWMEEKNIQQRKEAIYSQGGDGN